MEREDRIAAATGRMKDRGLALVAAFSNGVHGIETPDAVALLSGFRPLGECMVLLDADGRSTLHVTPAWDAARAGRRSSTTETLAAADLPAAFARAVSGAGLGAADVGVVALARMPRPVADGVRAALGGEPAAFDDVLLGIPQLTLGGEPAADPAAAIARRKTDSELTRAADATAIAEAGHRHMLAIARPGMPEYELAAEMIAQMAALGADDNFLMLSARPHDRAVMPSSGRLLEAGDVIIAEATPCFEGQFSQICRTAVLGQAPDVMEEKYALVVEAMEAGIAAARPGKPMSAVCGAVDAVLTAHGYGEYCRPPHMRRRGHGLGLSSVVPGNVTADSDVILDEGMFFVVHPNQYLPETGYLLCGEPIVVTADGGRAHTRETAWLASIAL